MESASAGGHPRRVRQQLDSPGRAQGLCGWLARFHHCTFLRALQRRSRNLGPAERNDVPGRQYAEDGAGRRPSRTELAVHAIGDKANRIVLEIFEEVQKQNGARVVNPVEPRADRRFRIEHAQHVHQDDFERFARLGVIASVQPYYTIDDGRWAEKRIGHERCKTSYAFRSFLDHGVRLAFGSDWTVAPLNPLLGIYAAVTRRTLDGKNPGGWFPEQKITLAEAIQAYTMRSEER